MGTVRGSRDWPRESPGSPPGPGYDVYAEGIEQTYKRRVAALQWDLRFRPWELPALLRGLQEERKLALNIVRERLARERFNERQARKRQTAALRPQGP